MLNDEQKAAVEKIDGAILVLAGAGSGKTRVVTYRIAHMLSMGVPPQEILGLTFTNKAAQEMKERVESLTNQQVLIATFHSLGARILRESIEVLGYPKAFTIYDEQDTEKLLKGCLTELFPDDKKIDPKKFRKFITDAKNALQRPEEAKGEEEMVRTFALYQEKLKSYGALDFDDLLYLTVRLFKEHPEVLAVYQERWRYVMIDEYQDTNHAQYTLINKLVEKSGNICVVGDPDQSIYSWRGANIHNILEFENDFSDVTVVRLEQNYRSSETIIEAANALIEHNENRYEKSLWSDNGKGEKIVVFEGYDDREEARFVFERVCTHYQNLGIPLRDMCVFYRTNAQSRVFEDYFQKKRLPYTIIGGVSFYQRKEIKDVLAYLRVVQSDSDFISFQRTVNLPKRGLGETTLEKIRAEAYRNEVPVLEYCYKVVSEETSLKLPKKQLEGLKFYLNEIYHLRSLILNGATIEDLVSQVIFHTGYIESLREDEETFEERRENLNALVAKAKEAADQPLESFLEELSLKGSTDEMTEDGDAINLMTIHHGKGLEFEVVFLVGMEEELFPHINSYRKGSAMEEERRLCYVGMTRAKKILYMTHARQRHLFGSIRYQRGSRFLDEVPAKYIVNANLVAV